MRTKIPGSEFRPIPEDPEVFGRTLPPLDAREVPNAPELGSPTVETVIWTVLKRFGDAAQ